MQKPNKEPLTKMLEKSNGRDWQPPKEVATTPKLYEVWSGGWSATGQRGGATYHGSAVAYSFREACIKVFGNDKLFDKRSLTYWACRLYDHRVDPDWENDWR
jgi:hypothetical protein